MLAKRLKTILILFLILVVVIGASSFVSYQSQNSTGKSQKTVTITVEKGENFMDVGKKLEKEGLVSNSFYFSYYVWTRELSSKIIAGQYEIGPNMKIPEIVRIMTEGETKPGYISVTFPEGWTAEEMAQRLNDKNLPGDDFLALAKNPATELISNFDFFKDKPAKASLEGYLFPDTYFFAPEASAEDIVMKMLKNFDSRLTDKMRNEITLQKKTYFEILTMASIVESEVSNEKDRGLVGGIFWKRLEMGMALQSDATLAYAIGGKKKVQHDAKDLETDSPYNTYKYKGLPPGPISNPGVASMNAAINPTKSNYLYFLNNPETGETFFAENFEQHVQNKSANGL